MKKIKKRTYIEAFGSQELYKLNILPKFKGPIDNIEKFFSFININKNMYIGKYKKENIFCIY